ncbi:hypothetical protein LXL04_015884 [Taraxacum kok-saghyz]
MTVALEIQRKATSLISRRGLVGDGDSEEGGSSLAREDEGLWRGGEQITPPSLSEIEFPRVPSSMAMCLQSDLMSEYMEDNRRKQIIIDQLYFPKCNMILESLSFDRGYYLLVKSIQEGIVAVSIGGPSGSGKSSVISMESIIGCSVISMENYRTGADEGNNLNLIDFDLVVQNLQNLLKGNDILTPVFDFQTRRRTGTKEIKSTSFGVVIVDGTYALHARLRSLLDICVAVVGGVHFSLLSKVEYDIGESCSLDNLIDSIFPLFRKYIDPDLHHAHIRINNNFGQSFRDSINKLKCKSESESSEPAYSFPKKEAHIDNFSEMYLRPLSASEEALCK